mmetsp:Transcript_38205/g.28153  ORF Transcript_38205/g.28153 Transcript_38205/m.28153 type:complete len:147 (+) Transcript_38205:316-756(+)
MLQRCKYYVYDFDGVNQTGLHWAAKRNFGPMIDLLIESGANVNAFDVGGRTPLYLATKMNNLEAVKALLASCAVPIYKTASGKNAFDVATNSVIERYLVKAQLLQICLKMISPKKRQYVWENEGLYYFRGNVEELGKDTAEEENNK